MTFALSRSHAIPPHPAMPASHPVRDPHRQKLHPRNTTTSSGEGRHQAGVQERRGEAAAGRCPALSRPLNTPHYTNGMEEVSENTHRFGDDYQ